MQAKCVWQCWQARHVLLGSIQGKIGRKGKSGGQKCMAVQKGKNRQGKKVVVGKRPEKGVVGEGAGMAGEEWQQ